MAIFSQVPVAMRASLLFSSDDKVFKRHLGGELLSWCPEGHLPSYFLRVKVSVTCLQLLRRLRRGVCAFVYRKKFKVQGHPGPPSETLSPIMKRGLGCGWVVQCLRQGKGMGKDVGCPQELQKKRVTERIDARLPGPPFHSSCFGSCGVL